MHRFALVSTESALPALPQDSNSDLTLSTVASGFCSFRPFIFSRLTTLPFTHHSAQLPALEPRDHTDCGREKSPEAASSATALSDGGNRVNYEQDCAHDDSVLFNPEEADNTVWEDFMVPHFDTKDEQRLDLFGGLDKEIENLIKAESPSSEAFLDDKELLLPYSALLLPPQDNHSHQTPSYKLETSPPLLGEGKIPPPELSDNIEILESKWASHGQLVTFRKTATKIAEDYLEDQGIKLVNRPARSNAIQDSGAYKQGRKDSRKIDVRRKGISN